MEKEEAYTRQSRSRSGYLDLDIWYTPVHSGDPRRHGLAHRLAAGGACQLLGQGQAGSRGAREEALAVPAVRGPGRERGRKGITCRTCGQRAREGEREGRDQDMGTVRWWMVSLVPSEGGETHPNRTAPMTERIFR